jgi:hypothetical protein
LIISDEVKLSDGQQKKLLSFLKAGKDLVLLGANDINLPGCRFLNAGIFIITKTRKLSKLMISKIF